MNEEDASGWAIGAAAFAAFMMLMLGSWWIIAGIIALVDDTFYVATANYILQFDTTSWGWVHLILGIVTLLAGFAVFTGAVWARTVGVILAFIGTLVAFAWLPYYPFWAILLIVASVAAIWALTVHGRDIAV